MKNIYSKSSIRKFNIQFSNTLSPWINNHVQMGKMSQKVDQNTFFPILENNEEKNVTAKYVKITDTDDHGDTNMVGIHFFQVVEEGVQAKTYGGKLNLCSNLVTNILKCFSL